MHKIVMILACMFIACTAPAQTAVWRYDTSSDKWVLIGDERKEYALYIKPKITANNSTGLTLYTNVAYDAALAHSLGLQLPLGKKWSIGVDGYMAWLRKREKNVWWQFYGFDIYGRYWLNSVNAAPLTGFHIGLYAGTVTYDIYPKNKGYQSKKLLTTFRGGAEFGYSCSLSKRNDHWRMDVYGGLGLLHTRQDVYRPYGSGRYIREQRRWRNYPDLTRFGVTVGYVL